MTLSKHTATFAGRPVRVFNPDGKLTRAKCVFRIVVEDDESQSFPELLDLFLARYGGRDLTALVIGAWNYDSMLESAAEVVEALVAARDRMPNLRSLFLGDITYNECEISWIRHGDISPLLPAFPKLQEFRVRGTSNLTFGKIKHPALKSFAIESGGLPEALLQEVWDAKLPKLEHLELWLGTVSYDGIDSVSPLKKLLNGTRFPGLKYLGLRNCQIADQVAEAVAKSPLVARLRKLDLSLGNLGDDGARALLVSPAVKKLQHLDLHHHYLSPAVIAELKKLKVELDVRDKKTEHRYDDEVYRYITVSE